MLIMQLGGCQLACFECSTDEVCSSGFSHAGKPQTPAEHEHVLWQNIQWEDAKGLDAGAVQMLVKCSWPLLQA